MSVQARLTRLLLVTCLLGLVAAALAAWFVYDRQSRATEQSLAQSAHAVAELVDNELRGQAATLRVLAATATLQNDDLRGFYATATNVVGRDDTAVVLIDLAGQQRLNTRKPFGEALPPGQDEVRRMRQALGPDASFVTDLFIAPVAQRPQFAVQVPVYQGGHLAYHLGRSLPAESVHGLLTRQGFPPTWRLAVVDRRGVVVARSPGQDDFVGKQASPVLQARMRAATAGVNSGTTLDGIPVKAFFHRAPWSQWTVILSVPVAELRAPARQAALLLASFLAVLLGGALLAARHLARQIAEPVGQLHHAAQRLGAGQAIRYVPAGLAEIDDAGAALVTAAASIAHSQELLEQRVQEAIAQTEQAQQALQRAQKLEALGRLTGGVAHDFNNVLQTLTTAHDLMRRDPDPRHQARRLELCHQAIGRATALVAQLRSFGKVQDAVLREIDIARALATATPLFRNAIGKHATLVVEFPDELGTAWIDPVQLDMALLNLVINARDAVPEGGQVEVLAETAPEPGAVRLIVRDSGHGMSPDILGRVAEPFFTTKESGMGLGLAQVFAFAEQSGGSVAIDSAPGQGTRVTLSLPVHGAPTAPALPAESAAEPAGVLSVLLVDDEESIRDTTGASLEYLGWHVHTAGSGEEALAVLAATPTIEVVLSDIVMPGALDGIALAREIRRDRPHIAVVLATGYARERIDLTGIEILAKPYKVQDVRAAVERALARARHPVAQDD